MSIEQSSNFATFVFDQGKRAVQPTPRLDQGLLFRLNRQAVKVDQGFRGVQVAKWVP